MYIVAASRCSGKSMVSTSAPSSPNLTQAARTTASDSAWETAWSNPSSITAIRKPETPPSSISE